MEMFETQNRMFHIQPEKWNGCQSYSSFDPGINPSLIYDRKRKRAYLNDAMVSVVS